MKAPDSPQAASPDRAPQCPSPASAVQPAEAPAAARYSVLIVDDQPEMTEVVALWLRAKGHCVVCAYSGQEAATILHSFAVDVLITDILMPDGDGLELIQAAQNRKPPPRIIAISGGGKFMSARDCLGIAHGFGADRCLSKPFAAQELLAAIEGAPNGDGLRRAPVPHRPGETP